jgi:hypothetical protein
VESAPRIILAGPVRNVAKFLPRLFHTIQELIKDESLEICGLLVFENDSTDDTVSILQSWNVSIPVYLESFTKQTAIMGETRTERLSFARKRLWKSAIQLESRLNFDYILFLDMDLVNYRLSHVNSCFTDENLPSDWTVCCANSYRFYYDLFALRTLDDWLQTDYRKVKRSKKNQLLRHISATQTPIRVNSCFNGAAVYKYRQLKQHFGSNISILSSLYEGRTRRGEAICEHVVFHQRLLQLMPQARIFIQPKFLNNGQDLETLVQKPWRSQAVRERVDPALAESIKALPQHYKPFLENATDCSVAR